MIEEEDDSITRAKSHGASLAKANVFDIKIHQPYRSVSLPHEILLRADSLAKIYFFALITT